MLNWLSAACVAQWVEHVNIYILKLCVVISNPVLFNFINLTQVHNFTVSAQDIFLRYLP